MVLFGEHLSNKVVILSIHYSSISWCCSQKKELSLPQPLTPAATLVTLGISRLSCDSIAEPSRELVLVNTNQGNTELLVVRWISFLTYFVSGTKFAPDPGREWLGAGDAQVRPAGEKDWRLQQLNLLAGV